MTNQRLPYLLSQYLGKSCSAAELREFYSLVGDVTNEKELQGLLEAAYSTTLTDQLLDDTRQAELVRSIVQQGANQQAVTASEFSAAEQLALSDQLHVAEELKRSGQLPWHVKGVKLWLRIAVAASIALTIGTAIYFFSTSRYPDASEEFTSAQYAKDIKPGKNTATLTLADGKTINLSDAKTGVIINNDKLIYTDSSIVGGRHPEFISGPNTGKDISQNRAPGFHLDDVVASTPRGGTYQIILPDGSKVWLNAASSIKFPSTFSGVAGRKVELISGEAYFEVAKVMGKGGKNNEQGTRIPFIVMSRGQRVEVLGTHFNINSYTDEESVKTTLLEGVVRVAPLTGRADDVLLKPGEQSLLNGDHIKVASANLEEAIAWKDGYFRFNNEKIESIMRKLARWYDVDVKYEGPVSEEEFNGRISRNKNISQVLKVLTSTKMIRFKIEGRRVTIMQ